MKSRIPRLSVFAALLLAGGAVPAQNYSINWYKIAGGGGASSGGPYAVNGTIGQQDAGGPMTGGGYSLNGGFWALYAIQTLGLPFLSIRRGGPNSVVVSWPNTGSYTLHTNGVVTALTWPAYGGSITTANGTNSVTITPPHGNLYFRLSSP